MDLILGMIGAVIGVGLFSFGFYLGSERSLANSNTKKDPELTEEEKKEFIEARRRFIEDQKAFTTLVNYNTSQAYGMNSDPFAT